MSNFGLGAVVKDNGMIVSPKKPPEQVKFRWDPDLIQRIREIAERTDRTMNDAGELLMRWAVDRAETELMAVSGESKRGRKPEKQE